MARPLRPFAFAVAALSVALSLFSVACKQGPGERCQVDRDCEEPYTCGNIKLELGGGTCGNGTTITVDAGSTPDGHAEAPPAEVAGEVASDVVGEAGADAPGSDVSVVPDASVETTPVDADSDAG